jgi:cell division protein FtsW
MHAREYDPWLLGAVLILTGLGITMIYSSSAMVAFHETGDGTYYLKRQAAFWIPSLALLAAAQRLDYQRYRAFVYPLLLLAAALLVAVLLPGVGRMVNGAKRWIPVGPVNIQPSEPAKLVFVLYLAHCLAKKGETVRSFSTGFVPPAIIACAMMGLILVEPDFGGAATLAVILLSLLFVAGTRISYLLAALLAALALASQLVTASAARYSRILAYVNPWKYRDGIGYNAVESMLSVGSGGIWGRGLGGGMQKLHFLPAAHTDFIFSTISEELGLAGVVAVCALFAVIVVRGLQTALGARDIFGTYLAFGITLLVGVQALTNMAVALALVPTKGLALPFASYGGSSLLFNYLAVGVLMNVYRGGQYKEEVARQDGVNQRTGPRRGRRKGH